MVKTNIPYRIKGFAFDMDGTLIDAAPWHYAALNKALFYYNCPAITQEEHLRVYNGLSSKRKLEMLASKGLLDACFIDTIVKLKQMYTEELIEKNCRPVQHILDVVKWCKERGPIVLVTNCSSKTTHRMLELAELAPLFGENVVSSSCTYGYIKPHPMPYKIGTCLLNLHPKEILAVEDTDKGVISATEADCRIWKIASHNELTIKNLQQILSDYEAYYDA